MLNAMPLENQAKAQRVMEINAENPVFDTLCALYRDDQEKLKKYSRLLYAQALLIEGLSVEDPVAFSQEICELMTR